MRPGRAPPGCSSSRALAPRMMRGFNEAGARAPRMLGSPAELSTEDKSFNEAGARAPRMPGFVDYEITRHEELQ